MIKITHIYHSLISLTTVTAFFGVMLAKCRVSLSRSSHTRQAIELAWDDIELVRIVRRSIAYLLIRLFGTS